MSSVISFIIGPVGFLVMGIAIYRSFKNVKSWDEAVDIMKASWKEISSFTVGDYDRGIMAFKYIAATRIVLRENLNKEIEQEKLKIQDRKNHDLQNHDNMLQKEILINEINKKIQNEIIVKKNIEDEILKLEADIRSINSKIEIHSSDIKRLKLSADTYKSFISASKTSIGISNILISKKQEKIN